MLSASKKLNYWRGALFAVGGIVVGVILWTIVWEMGFIASLSTFAMAWLVVWLYRQGAGGINLKSLYIIFAYIILGILLSLFASFVSDGLHYVIEEEKVNLSVLSLLTMSEFWAFIGDNIANSEILGSYTSTIFMSLLLGGLGIYGTVKDVFIESRQKLAEHDIQTKEDA